MIQKKYTSRFWKRFFKKKLALISLGVILITVLISIFAYPLSTDKNADANTLILEIGTRPMGFSCFLLKKKLNDSISKKSVIDFLFFGNEIAYNYIPVKNYSIKEDSIFYEKIIDENLFEKESKSLSFFAKKDCSIEAFKKSNIEKRTFLLGTDRFGRDLFSRLLLGSRVSIAVGLIAVFISIFIGVLLGSFSAYYGGWVDSLIMWLINVVWAIPTLLLVFAITMALGKGFWIIFIAVGLTMWVGTARLIRGQVLSLKELEYIQAAKVLGYSNARIILKHILPNIIGPTVVMAASNFATAILIEAGLSFLGIGVQPPTPSWGLMIKENYNFIITNRPMLAIIPGLAIMFLVLAFNLLGNGLRDALDVKEKV